jgi:hypothetical protein
MRPGANVQVARQYCVTALFAESLDPIDILCVRCEPVAQSFNGVVHEKSI